MKYNMFNSTDVWSFSHRGISHLINSAFVVKDYAGQYEQHSS